MNRAELRAYLLRKQGSVEDRPFGPDTAVFKVMGKMFALFPDQGELTINLKCDPDEALFLRDIYPAVQPGYHMNKRHWNTVFLDGSIPEDVLQRMIDDSYALVVGSLPRTARNELQAATGA